MFGSFSDLCILRERKDKETSEKKARRNQRNGNGTPTTNPRNINEKTTEPPRQIKEKKHQRPLLRVSAFSSSEKAPKIDPTAIPTQRHNCPAMHTSEYFAPKKHRQLFPNIFPKGCKIASACIDTPVQRRLQKCPPNYLICVAVNM